MVRKTSFAPPALNCVVGVVRVSECAQEHCQAVPHQERDDVNGEACLDKYKLDLPIGINTETLVSVQYEEESEEYVCLDDA